MDVCRGIEQLLPGCIKLVQPGMLLGIFKITLYYMQPNEAPSYWKKGLAFEAAECVVSAAFNDHAIHRIVARAYRSDTRSIVLMKRLGMVYDRVLDSTPVDEIVLFSLNLLGHSQRAFSSPPTLNEI